MEKATSTSPLVKDGKRLTRRFLGELFPKTTKEKNELKAYTKGHDQFTFGKELVRTHDGGVMIVPKMHDVRQVYFYI